MGYVSCVGYCISCRRLFTFNPVKVPSIRVNGLREPVCRTCIEAANPKRIANGLAPVEIAPDAYEACAEEELEI